MKKSRFFSKIYQNTHLWIILTCIGVWILVFCNLFSRNKTVDVYVVGGQVEVSNTIDACVSNTVDVNIDKFNGLKRLSIPVNKLY